MAKTEHAAHVERRRRSDRVARRGAGLVFVVALSMVAAVCGSSSTPVKLGVPAYGYPAEGPLWNAMAALPPGSSIIVDPADGPGKAIDPTYQTALVPVRDRGVKIFGYIDTAFGARDVAVIIGEAATYGAWYQPSGIFLDQTPGGSSFLAAFRKIIAGLRARGYEVVLNPGQPEIEPEYVAMADHVINFEGTWESYRKFREPGWVRTFPPAKFWHLVHSAPDPAAMRRAVRLARKRHAGTVYVTDAIMPNPWNRLPSYWSEETKLVALERRS